MSGRSVIAGLLTVIVVLVGIAFFSGRVNFPSFGKKSTQSKLEKQISDEQKTSHFVASVPGHGEVFAKAPVSVVINANTALTADSKINISKDEATVVEQKVKMEENASLRQQIGQDLSDGVYTVNYSTCAAQGCEDGSFQFIVDSKLRQEYIDMTMQESVTISMNNLSFDPQKVIVSAGTIVTWQNDEEAIHFVNSDPIDLSTYFVAQNSREIKQNEMYSVKFEIPGEYPYHCRAHVSSGMNGRIIVE